MFGKKLYPVSLLLLLMSNLQRFVLLLLLHKLPRASSGTIKYFHFNHFERFEKRDGEERNPSVDPIRISTSAERNFLLVSTKASRDTQQKLSPPSTFALREIATREGKLRCLNVSITQL